MDRKLDKRWFRNMAVDLKRAGNWGTFVHINNPLYWEDRECPFCGCESFFAFCFNGIKEGEFCIHSHPDDTFECAGCGATTTRDNENRIDGPHRVRVGQKVYNV